MSALIVRTGPALFGTSLLMVLLLVSLVAPAGAQNWRKATKRHPHHQRQNF